jgi:glycosyltransferase involved in cell wall biosynthesis
MKIIELCLSPDLGGLELYMYRCCEALSRMNVEVIPVIRTDGRIKNYIDRLDLRPYPLKTSFRKLPLLAAQRLARIIDEKQVDAVHIHWGRDLPLAALTKALSKTKPRLVYTRQMMLTRAKDDIYHRFMYRQMDLMLTITRQLEQAARSRLPGECQNRVRTLYHGVNEPTKLAGQERNTLRSGLGVTDSNAVLIGLFGRIEPFKAQHLLIEAINHASNRELPIHLLIVGHAMNQDYLNDLKSMVKDNALTERVRFMDFVDNPNALMQACDVIALTTIEETFGLVLIEAMRAGVAVLGSDAGGVPEIIQHEVNGLLFEPGNEQSLAEQVHRYVSDYELRERMASAGKEHAKKIFNADMHYKELKHILEGNV